MGIRQDDIKVADGMGDPDAPRDIWDADGNSRRLGPYPALDELTKVPVR